MTFEADAPSLSGLIQWVEKWTRNYEERQEGSRGRPLQPYEQRELAAYRGIHLALLDLQKLRYSGPETRSALSEPCDKCAGHHDIGNPCPAEACPTCKRIYCECPTANRLPSL